MSYTVVALYSHVPYILTRCPVSKDCAARVNVVTMSFSPFAPSTKMEPAFAATYCAADGACELTRHES